jgi:prepilin-type N-terminal cleavage/methylation domain-containing protein
MDKHSGFTIIELMVVVGILGILMASSVPLYRTWQQRAYGSEAAIMIKQILDAEIVYFLENEEFYPPINMDRNVNHIDKPDSEDVLAIAEHLNITIPTGHFLNYYLSSREEEGILLFQLDVSSLNNSFYIYEKAVSIIATVDQHGEIEYVIPY